MSIITNINGFWSVELSSDKLVYRGDNLAILVTRDNEAPNAWRYIRLGLPSEIRLHSENKKAFDFNAIDQEGTTDAKALVEKWISDKKLDTQIVANQTKVNEPYSLDDNSLGVLTNRTFSATNTEYLIYAIKANGSDVRLAHFMYSVSSTTNDDYITRILINPTFDTDISTFFDDFEDSGLQKASPSYNGLGSVVKVTGFGAGGKQMFAKGAQGNTTIESTIMTENILPDGVIFALTLIPKSGNAEGFATLNLSKV